MTDAVSFNENGAAVSDSFEADRPKYILDRNDSIINGEGRRLYRIIYKDGGKGGWLEDYDCLSQLDECRVLDEAQVYGQGRVYEKALVYGQAKVYGFGWVFGAAKVYGKAMIFGQAEIHGQSEVFGEAKIYGRAEVCGRAKVYDTSSLCEDAKAGWHADISGNSFISGITEVDLQASDVCWSDI